MNTLIKCILLLSCFFTQPFAQAAVSNPSAEETNKVSEQNTSPSKKLKDIKFEDAALNLCVKDAAGKNGYDAVFADEIKALDCTNNIRSLAGIEYLSSLEQIVLIKTEIKDLTPISTLKNLRTLIIEGSQIEDISPLSHLSKLAQLILTKARIENVSPLRNLSKLMLLELKNNRIKSVRTLDKLTNLASLGLGENPIKCAQIVDLYVKLIAGQENIKSIYTSIYPKCESELSERKLDILAAEESIKNKKESTPKPKAAVTSLQKEQINIDQNVKKLIYERDIKGLSSWLKEKPNALIDFKINGSPLFNIAVKAFLYQQDNKEDFQFLEWLLEHGADINSKDANQKIALNYLYDQSSFNTENKPLLKFLLKRGADINYAPPNQPTILIAAVNSGRGNLDWVRELIELGANVNGQDTYKKTALSHLYDYGLFNIQNKPLLELLLKYGADINYAPPNNATILTAAVGARGGNLDWVKELIALGADINGQDGLGRTALMMSYGNQFYEVFEYLLSLGTNINLRDKSGSTLIYQVVWYLNNKENDKRSEKAKHYAVVLLERKLKFDLNNKYDREAYEQCVRYLPTYFQNIKPEQLINREP